jgi:phenylalanyl-tRNA synthetase alpha chain
VREELHSLLRDADSQLSSVDSAEALEIFRVAFLGRKGKLAALFDQFKDLSSEDRKIRGQALNELKKALEDKVEAKQSALSSRPRTSQTAFDPTLPGVRPSTGRIHPLIQTIREIVSIFEKLGFETVDGPEVETEFYNFTALNIPADHPSRDSFATFYVRSENSRESLLLRSQTSTVQVRVMQKRKPPLRIIAPGRVYRPDPVDASHSFMFHQIEGLMVDDRTTFSELKGILHLFLRRLFGPDIQIRFRPHFFPFTEPSVEVDIEWGKGWLEILGAGIVHPNVFEAVGYDAKKFQGFAFGLGVERIAMLRHGIQDIRLFYENDLRFLRQF